MYSSTVTALVESAFFNPDIIIGKTVKYDLTSEASYRFERSDAHRICTKKIYSDSKRSR